MNRIVRGLAAAFLFLPSTVGATPLLSEVFYDAVGTDDGQVFVELYGAPGTDLTGLVVEGINGSNGAVTDSIALSGVMPMDGFFVVADALFDGTTLVGNADLIGSFDFQNGPDSIVLRSPDAIVDALGYGVFGAGDVFAGEGTAALDAPAGASLARRFADLDSSDNAADFAVLEVPTPGSGPLSEVPEPASGLLLAGGLALTSRLARHSRHR